MRRLTRRHGNEMHLLRVRTASDKPLSEDVGWFVQQRQPAVQLLRRDGPQLRSLHQASRRRKSAGCRSDYQRMNDNWPAALAFVWQPNFDSPQQGVHTTPGDPGGTTYGGVIQATWDNAVKTGIVRGLLTGATIAQLSTVLRLRFWGDTCDALPRGVDLLYFNGHIMSEDYPYLLQQCLGFTGPADVDGWIGPETLRACRAADSATLINAMSGAHYAYLTRLAAWAKFKDGWTTRLRAAQVAAHGLADGAPVA
jgi:hypothetical protein